MQVRWPLPRRVRFQPDSPRQRSHNLHETYQLPRVQLITPDDGHRRCPKHVEFRDKIKILDTWCILLVIYMKIITMHGHLNIKYCNDSSYSIRFREYLPDQQLSLTKFKLWLIFHPLASSLCRQSCAGTSCSCCKPADRLLTSQEDCLSVLNCLYKISVAVFANC
jgi:hypothetical protein